MIYMTVRTTTHNLAVCLQFSELKLNISQRSHTKMHWDNICIYNRQLKQVQQRKTVITPLPATWWQGTFTLWYSGGGELWYMHAYMQLHTPHLQQPAGCCLVQNNVQNKDQQKFDIQCILILFYWTEHWVYHDIEENRS